MGLKLRQNVSRFNDKYYGEIYITNPDKYVTLLHMIQMFVMYLKLVICIKGFYSSNLSQDAT